MASTQYFRGLALLAMLMMNPELTWGQTSTDSTTDTGSMVTSPSWTAVSGSAPPSWSPSPSDAAMSDLMTPETMLSGPTDSGSTNAPSMISCRQFTCNESQCYSMFMNQTATACDSSFSHCELQRTGYMNYTMGCSADCPATPCMNQTQTGCSVECCNTTDCLNMTATMFTMVHATAAPTTARTTTEVTSLPTPASNGKKCNQLTCTGENCYTESSQKNLVVSCRVGQDYCQLKKTVAGPVMTWTAGCSGDCRDDKICTSTAVDCTRECCNATLNTSCLKLDGSLNMPGSASPPALGPAPLVLASGLLAWLLSSQLHAL